MSTQPTNRTIEQRAILADESLHEFISANGYSKLIDFSSIIASHFQDLGAGGDELADALRLILPMAKGYAHNNPVGNNWQFCEQAESVLAQHTPGREGGKESC